MPGLGARETGSSAYDRHATFIAHPLQRAARDRAAVHGDGDWPVVVGRRVHAEVEAPEQPAPPAHRTHHPASGPLEEPVIAARVHRRATAAAMLAESASVTPLASTVAIAVAVDAQREQPASPAQDDRPSAVAQASREEARSAPASHGSQIPASVTVAARDAGEMAAWPLALDAAPARVSDVAVPASPRSLMDAMQSVVLRKPMHAVVEPGTRAVAPVSVFASTPASAPVDRRMAGDAAQASQARIVIGRTPVTRDAPLLFRDAADGQIGASRMSRSVVREVSGVSPPGHPHGAEVAGIIEAGAARAPMPAPDSVRASAVARLPADSVVSAPLAGIASYRAFVHRHPVRDVVAKVGEAVASDAWQAHRSRDGRAPAPAGARVDMAATDAVAAQSAARHPTGDALPVVRSGAV
ncbi:MAG TPA: hypothetical protein VN289_05815, partial [Paraburkholderia sp.]|nr:hypothetical protein [Paraburkholderia sp.]